VVFGEWAPRESDVDFLATLAHRPEPAEVEALRGVHAQMAAYSSIRFDGPHVLAADLACDPRTLPPVPEVMFTRELETVASPSWMIVWHELAQAGITVTGPELSTLRYPPGSTTMAVIPSGATTSLRSDKVSASIAALTAG
jgi:hypothetical protein